MKQIRSSGPLLFSIKMLLLCSILLVAAESYVSAVDVKQPAAKTKAGNTGIAFIENNWDAALQQAKTSKKLIFVDAYATWCGPCKLLKSTTFKDTAAAAYFNSHFINLSLDVEKGKGPELATQWKIQGLPTLLVLDANKKVVAQSVGYLGAGDLLEWAKQVLAQNKPVQQAIHNPYYSRTDTQKLSVSNTIWKKILPDDLYAVARENATERAFTGKYWQTDERGTYYCAVCGNPLFRSGAKFASTCGWPSFFETIRPNSVLYLQDNSHGMERTEVRCGRCNSHLGHIFDDGPPPSHKRYCMNSISLEFEPAK